MNCGECHSANPDSARFCEECGAQLIVLCPGCGESIPAGKRFCRSCGAELPLDAGSLRRGGASAPMHLAQKILSSRAGVEGERKQVTVLFADVKGSMELLAERDPEEARAILDPILRLMMDAVHRFEGTVNQVMGDGIMALFGAPLAHEDHAARACYAALTMQEGVRHLGQEAIPTRDHDVLVRVGINSGEVVVRAIGSDLRMDYSAIGETTHLAARMEADAPPGSIRLTRATLRLAEPFVQARTLGLMPVKGKRDLVEVFELMAARGIRRIQATRLRGLSQFVGRESELARLSDALVAAAAGRGSVIAVAGEPGIGKSRLFLEFTQPSAVANCLVLEAGTVSYGRTTPYLPILDLLRRYFGIPDDALLDTIRQTVTSTLLTLDSTLSDAVAPMLALFGAVPDDSPFPTYDPLRRRTLTHEALSLFFHRLSRAEPLVFIVEDLQWIDAESQAVLDQLVDSVSSARILLLFNYRSEEYQHDWAGKPQFTEIHLSPLDRRPAERLLSALLGDSPRLRQLKDLLIERTDRNPFFLEESVRSLVDSKTLLGEPGRYQPAGVVRPDMPATVQAVLAARIDRLPPDQKRVLQCAAVVGKEVRMPLVQAVLGMTLAQLDNALAGLQRADFIYEHLPQRPALFSFKHSLTQEVAYGGLLHDQAKALHAAVVTAIEALHAQHLEEQAEALAHHAVRGEVWPKAVDYLRRAGAAAFGRSAIEESLRCYEDALRLADKLPPGVEHTGRHIDVRLDLHVPLIVLGQVSRLIDLHAESERLAVDLHDAPRLARLRYRMSQYAWIQGRFQDGLQHAEQALSIAHTIGDAEVRTVASYALGLNHCLLGNYRTAVDLFLQVVDGPDAARAKRLLAVTIPAYIGAASWLGYSLTLIGDLERALLYSDRAAAAADESDHPQAQAIAYTLRVVPLLYGGQVGTAVALGESALRLCETNALLVWLPAAAATLGWALSVAGRVQEGVEQLERGAAMMETIGVLSNLSRVHVWWAEALLAAGRRLEARRTVERGLEFARTYGERGYEAEALHTLARTLVAEAGTDVRSVAAYYEQALQLADKLGMSPLVGRCHLGLGRMYAGANDGRQARAHFDRAAGIFHSLGLHLWLAEAQAGPP